MRRRAASGTTIITTPHAAPQMHASCSSMLHHPCARGVARVQFEVGFAVGFEVGFEVQFEVQFEVGFARGLTRTNSFALVRDWKSVEFLSLPGLPVGVEVWVSVGVGAGVGDNARLRVTIHSRPQATCGHMQLWPRGHGACTRRGGLQMHVHLKLSTRCQIREPVIESAASVRSRQFAAPRRTAPGRRSPMPAWQSMMSCCVYGKDAFAANEGQLSMPTPHAITSGPPSPLCPMPQHLCARGSAGCDRRWVGGG